MLLEGKMWIKFMISVAMACTVKDRPGFPLDGNETAEFIRDVLYIALDGQHLPITVSVIPYRVTTKVPLVLTIGRSEPHLFWYYPTQSQDEMSDQLADLVCDLKVEYAALATA